MFDEDRYFDVEVDYAKAGPEDLVMRVTVRNRGDVDAPLDVLPTLWFRNTWSWDATDPDLFYFNTVVASFVILSLFDPLREKVEEWVVATLFHERYELVRRLEGLRDRTGNVIDPGGLAAVVLDGLVETRRVTKTGWP